MSVEQQANMSSPWPGAGGAKARGPGGARASGRGLSKVAKTFLLIMAFGLLLGGGLAYVSHHFGVKSSGPGTEGNQPAAALANADSTDYEAVVPVTQLPITGSQYRVAGEKAFFFVDPQQAAPIKRFLQRGDVFYADGETDGFVRTSFVQMDGAQGAGWLKVRELNKIQASPAAKTAETVAAPAATALAVASTKPVAKPAAHRARATQSRAAKPAARTRVGSWLRRAREKVLPSAADKAKRKKKKPPCKCACAPIGSPRLAAWA